MENDEERELPKPINVALIDSIYTLLDGIEEDIRNINENYKYNQDVPVYIVGSICDAALFLTNWSYEGRLGLTEMDLTKLRRMQGGVRASVLLMLAQRMTSLLHEFEGQVASEFSELARLEETEQLPNENEEFAPISAMQWVPLRRQRNADLIAEISVLLDEAIMLSRNVNLPRESRALTDIERAQLIVLLETAIKLLAAPLVEKGLLKKLKNAAQTGAAKAVERKSELALGYALGKAAELISKLFDSL